MVVQVSPFFEPPQKLPEDHGVSVPNLASRNHRSQHQNTCRARANREARLLVWCRSRALSVLSASLGSRPTPEAPAKEIPADLAETKNHKAFPCARVHRERALFQMSRFSVLARQ